MNNRKFSWKLFVFGTPIALLLGGCEPARDFISLIPGADQFINQPLPSFPAQTPNIAEMEAAIHQQINEIRLENNLQPLENNERLAQVARQYSQRMAQENFFSHTGPDGDTPAQRVRDGGIIYLMVGENLFRGTNISDPVSAAVQGWMDSPGHRKNILRSVFAETGVGVWREGNQYYITQMFLRSLL
ncbi:CAP domain-containing protein [Gloeocapsopsis dulcis]|uniref:SCP domain-containing protein n=1 Tax=Gloeocapsopsis dulcis AAB1 = 1H9 TaxID=1433147 RepID=A0A6N8G2S0_9CHRO|nr:CAP domain-containing protein [Gloeocapsopsis dulcis]MUL39254.1 hypothetical protein [Gloeocapsopsis dulcis AAB1 = 1H9]WNN90860.1 CAP domain-containing protein [Gloeocapsopsis dulcis]